MGSLEVLEARERLGGRIWSERFRDGARGRWTGEVLMSRRVSPDVGDNNMGVSINRITYRIYIIQYYHI